MAEELLRSIGGDQFAVESAGIEPGKLNPLVIEVLKEIGIDISSKGTISAHDLFKQGKEYDYVITVCDEANAERCPTFPGVKNKIHWNFEDPSQFDGTPEEKLTRTREIREQIKEEIEDWLKRK